MPALTMKETPTPASIPTKQKLEEQIRRRAYELYEARGCEDGHELEDWLQPKSTSLGMPQPAPQPKAALSVFRLPTSIRRNSMSEYKCKALILDSDPDALIALQRTLENGGVDTTITWDNAEARNLARTTPFDVILIGDHPPEISAETAVRDFRFRGVISPCLVLRTIAREMDPEGLRRLGVIKVVPKRDPDRVLEQVQGTCGLKTAFPDRPTL